MRGTFDTTADLASAFALGAAFSAAGLASALAFVAAGFLTAGFLAAGFLAAGFFAGGFLAAAFLAAGLEAAASTACSSFLLSGAFATLDHPNFRPVFEDLLTRSTDVAGLWIDEHYIR